MKKTSYKIQGINVLNRTCLDSSTILQRIHRRRETHNQLERKRRDSFNKTIFHLATLLPQSPTHLHKGAILKLTLDHVRSLHQEIHSLKAENAALRLYSSHSSSSSSSSPLLSHQHPPHHQPISVPGTPSRNPSRSHSHSRSPSPSSSPSRSPSPPIIPGPGQGMIPSLSSSYRPLGSTAPSSSSSSTTGSAISSPSLPSNPSLPPRISTTTDYPSSSPSFAQLRPLHPVPQPSKISTTSTPNASPSTSLSATSNPSLASILNDNRPFSDDIHDIRMRSSSPTPPFSLPLPSIAHHGYALTLANALPIVPSNHQRSAAVSAAAVSARAAAAATIVATTVATTTLSNPAFSSLSASSSSLSLSFSAIPVLPTSLPTSIPAPLPPFTTASRQPRIPSQITLDAACPGQMGRHPLQHLLQPMPPCYGTSMSPRV